MKLKLIEELTFGAVGKFVSLQYPVMIFEIEDFHEIKHGVVSEIDEIESMLKKLDYKKDDGGTGAHNALTNAHNIFNFFDSQRPEIQRLRDFWVQAAKIYSDKVYGEGNKLFFKSWANKLNRFEALKEHVHSAHELFGETVGFSAHLSIKCGNNNHTVYRCYCGGQPLEMSIPNKEGQIVVFPSSLPHSTFPNPNHQTRYTVAGDFAFDKPLVTYRAV